MWLFFRFILLFADLLPTCIYLLSLKNPYPKIGVIHCIYCILDCIRLYRCSWYEVHSMHAVDFVGTKPFTTNQLYIIYIAVRIVYTISCAFWKYAIAHSLLSDLDIKLLPPLSLFFSSSGLMSTQSLSLFLFIRIPLMSFLWPLFLLSPANFFLLKQFLANSSRVGVIGNNGQKSVSEDYVSYLQTADLGNE